MCRHLAYLGPVRSLAALVLEPAYGLLRQSYAPRDMRGGGTINADGFGVGWYPSAGSTAPTRYRSDRPLWADQSFAEVAAVTGTGALLAAIRSATVGMPVVNTASAPFTDGRWLFSHNGVVLGWPSAVAGLAGELPVTDLLTLDAPTDSALLWAMVRHRLRSGEEPGSALAGVVNSVAAAAPGSKLNLLLTDGVQIYATAWRHSLVVRTEPDAVTVGSEPHDEEPGWTPVPEGHLLVGRPGHADTVPIASPAELPRVAWQPNGAAVNGAAANGAAVNGAAVNGAAANGAGRNGGAANGAAVNGAGRNGAATNGAGRNGARRAGADGAAVNDAAGIDAAGIDAAGNDADRSPAT
ncbi:MAG: gamma-glutamyl hercynylcysteine S-oxide hydrolase [Pseudonocardiales bacterium]|nr:gamma-glutamyl hercynylcysteine S-oxide hydrolase [Pseudonocardiales bacterium]